MKIIIYSFLSFFLTVISLYGQEEEEINVGGFTFLDYSKDLPDDLISSRSIVFVTVPPKAKNTSERGPWKEFAREAHSQFVKMGIDPVGYYYIDDLYSGYDSHQAYFESMEGREIKNVIILSKVLLNIKGKESTRYVILITAFNNKRSFMDHGQNAWKDQNKSFDKVIRKLGKDILKEGLEKTNFLVLDKPQFYTDVPFFEGSRTEFFPLDLNTSMLAVPMFQKKEIPENRPDGIINNKVVKLIEEYNSNVDQWNKELKDVMKNYPYKYELVDAASDFDIKGLGYQFVMRRIYTSGKVIKELLDYDVDAEDSFVTVKNIDGKVVMRTIPIEALVNKYYIKHLFNNETFIGSRWDADELWADAIENYFRNYFEEMKKLR